MSKTPLESFIDHKADTGMQCGYQANGKTITTSDQLLETLIGLKR